MLTTRVEPHPAARAVTALAVSTAGLLVLRRIPRPARRPAELLLAASSPWVASYLTQLGRAAGARVRPAPVTGLESRHRACPRPRWAVAHAAPPAPRRPAAGVTAGPAQAAAGVAAGPAQAATGVAASQ